MATVYTIGHSNHTMDRLLELLRAHAIARLVDVRSTAASAYNPQFNGPVLRAAAEEAGLAYAALPDLGGKPRDSSFLQPDGTPDYDRMARSPRFTEALRQLVLWADDAPTAILCAEADPAVCHRERLIGTELRRLSHEVRHILPDATIAAPVQQLSLNL